MERKATKPGMNRLNFDPDKPGLIPVEGELTPLEYNYDN